MPPRTQAPSRRNPLERALDVARYYGFGDAHALLRERHERVQMRRTAPQGGRQRRQVFPAIDRCETNRKYGSLLGACLDCEAFDDTAHPIQLYFHNARKTHKPTQGTAGTQLCLEIFGRDGGLGEALLVCTATAILRELGFDGLTVRVNSLGDRESLERFVREITLYYRRYAQSLHAVCREALRKDIFRVLNCTNERCRAIHEDAPTPIASLTENSRVHFKEVLEYLDAMDVAYEIDHTLVGEGHYVKTVFEIHTAPATNTVAAVRVASGGRYDSLSRRIGLRKDIPALGVRIPIAVSIQRTPKAEPRRSARAHFIQLGPEAQRKSFAVLELLRQAKIAVHHALGANHLSRELRHAEQAGVPYTLIMGHKEALEGTVIVRDTDTRSQETVEIARLPAFLKRGRR